MHQTAIFRVISISDRTYETRIRYRCRPTWKQSLLLLLLQVTKHAVLTSSATSYMPICRTAASGHRTGPLADPMPTWGKVPSFSISRTAFPPSAMFPFPCLPFNRLLEIRLCSVTLVAVPLLTTETADASVTRMPADSTCPAHLPVFSSPPTSRVSRYCGIRNILTVNVRGRNLPAYRRALTCEAHAWTSASRTFCQCWKKTKNEKKIEAPCSVGSTMLQQELLPIERAWTTALLSNYRSNFTRDVIVISRILYSATWNLRYFLLYTWTTSHRSTQPTYGM